MRGWSTVLMVLACLACQSTPQPQKLKFEDSAWDGLLERLPHALGPASELEKQRSWRGIPLRFRVGGADLGKQRDRVETDPTCGDSVEIFVRRLPSPAAGAVGSEEVIELGPDGDVLESWPIPPDKPVLAIRGDEIFVPHGVPLPGSRTLAVLLAIRPDGHFRVVARRSFAGSRYVSCPEDVALRGVFAPEQCRAHTDGSTLRTLAYESPCLAAPQS